MKSDSNHTPPQRFSNSYFDKARAVIDSFSPFERGAFWFLVIIFSGSSVILLGSVNKTILVKVPSSGGSITEGVLGSPRFINPLLAITPADRDLSSLIYSGLMKALPDGSLVPDLAARYSISPDGLTYEFIIREDASFHDGRPVTTADVLFTISKAQDPTLKSPRRASWDGVIVEKVNDGEVRFTLEQPYAPFLQNTTLGVLPRHIWGDADSEEFAFSQFNVEPIGSGPYEIRNIKRDGSGVPEFYSLKPFNNYALGIPHISNIVMRFYPNENKLVDAYLDGEIEALNSVTKNGLALIALNRKGFKVERSSLPRIFGVFFNQNQAPILANKEVREALNIALNKKRIVNEALGGNGTPIQSPLPPGILEDINNSTIHEGDKGAAIKLLEANKWKVNEESGMWERKTKSTTESIRFSLATSEVPELRQIATLIKDEWEQIGISVDLKIFDSGDLNQNVIRPRKYEALFFGEIVGRELDLFAFWHSSQRNDPGLNIALYANITTDKLLEEVRTTRDDKERELKFIELETEIMNDVPAVFVYTPDFIYVVPQDVKGLDIGLVTTPSERYLGVHEWFIETDHIWSFFVEDKN